MPTPYSAYMCKLIQHFLKKRCRGPREDCLALTTGVKYTAMTIYGDFGVSRLFNSDMEDPA